MNINHLIKIIKKIYKKRVVGIFNVGSGQKTYLVDMIKILIKRYNKKLELIENSNKTYLIANIQKLKKELSLSKIRFNILKNL